MSRQKHKGCSCGCIPLPIPNVSRYRLLTASGKPIRWATQVEWPDCTVRFTELLSKKAAIEQSKKCTADPNGKLYFANLNYVQQTHS